MSHALLGASSSHRWLNCTPSARLEEAYQDTSSEYAQEGTLAHAMAETALRRQLGEIDHEGFMEQWQEYKKSPFFSEEMVNHIMEYVEAVLQLSETKGAKTFVEYKVDYSPIAPEGFGTADALVCTPSEYFVCDFKYGKGVKVDAQDNPQLKLYALGILLEQEMIWGKNPVSCYIFQPRLDSVSSATYSYRELVEWGEEIKPLAEKAYKGEGELCMGDWCRFCKHKLNCKKQMDEAFRMTNRNEPNKLSPEEISEILKIAPLVSDYIKSLENHALEMVRDQGQKIPGYKLVEGRSIRKYSDPNAIVEALTLHGYPLENILKKREPLGITDMEKLVGKKKFSELCGNFIVKPAGTPCLVPESDKRQEINTIEEAFREVENV